MSSSWIFITWILIFKLSPGKWKIFTVNNKKTDFITWEILIDAGLINFSSDENDHYIIFVRAAFNFVTE
jgi:hypothetical protein